MKLCPNHESAPDQDKAKAHVHQEDQPVRNRPHFELPFSTSTYTPNATTFAVPFVAPLERAAPLAVLPELSQ